MQRSTTRCLLDRLEQLNFDEHTGGWFGFPDTAPGVGKQVPYKFPPPPLFIEGATQDQMDDIEKTKQKITSCLNEINRMQDEAFEAQKKVMKVCYDFFSKYEGSQQSGDWARLFWFTLHDVDPDRQTTSVPEEWIEKMRFGKPSDYGSTLTSAASEEYRVKMVGYDLEKKEWEEYVDSKWNAAFEDAFGVKQFAEFLRKIPEKIGVNLETNTTKIVEKLWSDLYEGTAFFQKKISMDHVRCGGSRFTEITNTLRDKSKYGAQIKQWNERPEIVKLFYASLQALVDQIRVLKELLDVKWELKDFVDANGKSFQSYERWDPIKQRKILRVEKPVKAARTAKSTSQKDKAAKGGTKTAVKKKK
jgi:hypothetical protein